jgi:hypothetical protein
VRNVVQNSFEVKTLLPVAGQQWKKAFTGFERLLKN